MVASTVVSFFLRLSDSLMFGGTSWSGKFPLKLYVASGVRLVSSNKSCPLGSGSLLPKLPDTFSGSAGICQVSALYQ